MAYSTVYNLKPAYLGNFYFYWNNPQQYILEVSTKEAKGSSVQISKKKKKNNQNQRAVSLSRNFKS